MGKISDDCRRTHFFAGGAPRIYERIGSKGCSVLIARGFPDGSIKTGSHQPVLSRHRMTAEMRIRLEMPPLSGCAS